MGRSGKHDPDKMLVGAYITPEDKAMADIVVSLEGDKDFSAWLRSTIRARCRAHGIIVDGNIMTLRWSEEVEKRAERIRKNRDRRRRK